MRSALRIVLIAALGAYALVRFAIAMAGLAFLTGWIGPALAAALLIGLGWMLPVRAGAFVGAITLWHWPWELALLFVVPRLLPFALGLFVATRARFVHPRPLWRRAASGLESR